MTNKSRRPSQATDSTNKKPKNEKNLLSIQKCKLVPLYDFSYPHGPLEIKSTFPNIHKIEQNIKT